MHIHKFIFYASFYDNSAISIQFKFSNRNTQGIEILDSQNH